MVRKVKTSLTFAITIPDVMGVSIKEMRNFLKDAILAEQRAVNPDQRIKDVNLIEVKIHLTNKEVRYG